MTTGTDGARLLRFVSGPQVALPSQNGWYVDFNILPLTAPGLGQQWNVT